MQKLVYTKLIKTQIYIILKLNEVIIRIKKLEQIKWETIIIIQIKVKIRIG